MINEILTYLKTERPYNKIQIGSGDEEAPENIGAYPTFKIAYDMRESGLDSTGIP